MKDLADRLRHASVDPSAGYFGTLCGFALTELESFRAQVATLTADNRELVDAVNIRTDELHRIAGILGVVPGAVDIDVRLSELLDAEKKVATLTEELAAAAEQREHDAGYIEGCNESFAAVTAELARVKALVEGAEVVGTMKVWRGGAKTIALACPQDAQNMDALRLIPLIARPNLNLEQKP